MMILYSS